MKRILLGKKVKIIIIKNLAKLTNILTAELKSRIRSFKNAFAGIRILLESQVNAKIHACTTIVVSSAGFYFGLSSFEWCWMVAAIVWVWCSEALNTAIELLADATVPYKHPLIKQAKDIAAGAVLIAALGAAVTGILIFGPYLSELLK